MQLLDGTDELVGEVAGLVFTNPASGFAVVELAVAGAAGGAADDLPRATGPLAGLAPGQAVRLIGRWVGHPRYGPTFEALYYEQATPHSAAGLAAFLASERFHGVGAVLARRLVATFGLELAHIIDTQPERLAEVRGVSADRASTIAAAWREAGVLATLVGELGAVGVPAAVASLVLRELGEDALAIVADDPYRLLGVRGIRWVHVEALGARAGIDRLDPRRLAAGATAAHAELAGRGGHVAIPDELLTAEAARLLRIDRAGAQLGLDGAAAGGRLVLDGVAGQQGWYRPAVLAAERGFAAAVARLLAARSRVAAATRVPAAGRTAEGDDDSPAVAGLVPAQHAALTAALETAVSVLTGGPGTGKTRTVKALVARCDAHDLRIALCAPTGRAAKRLEEVSGRAATTIHRLLEARGEGGSGFVFGYGDTRRLPHDVVVADEWSMADIHLAHALARAVGDGAHLVLVGDADQLPSVGPGAVLRDLLADGVPVARTRLTQVHRQAATSRIVTLAHEINDGVVTVPRGRDADVFAVAQPSYGIGERVAEIVAVRAPAYFGCTPADVQVLAPMYRGPAGVDALNRALKERLNPARGRPAVGGFHEGDRVVQTRNDAELDVANGDIGEVTATDPNARTLEVAFPHGTVTYEGERSADLAPAWCLTVHKAQGGEWPVVVLACDPGHKAMLWRELVYTAVTRAAQGLLLVGEPSLLATAARRTGSGLRQRRTLLAERLRAGDAGPRAGIS